MKLLFCLLGLLILVSCNVAKETSKYSEKLPKVKTSRIISALDSLSGVSFGTFYSKISTKYEDSERKLSFKTSVRMVEDSALNILVTFARIPIINSIITKDSVKFTNKTEKCYSRRNMDFIHENFAVEFSHRNIEELLMGLPSVFDSTQKYYRVKDPLSYTVSTHRKHEIHQSEQQKSNDWIAFYTLTNDLRHLKRCVMKSPKDSVELHIDYLERQKSIHGHETPLAANVSIQLPDERILIELKYNKTRIGEKESIHFVIPENYVECE